MTWLHFFGNRPQALNSYCMLLLHYLSLGVHGHVHPYELLVGLPVRAALPEAERRVDVAHHLVNVVVVDLAAERENNI